MRKNIKRIQKIKYHIKLLTWLHIGSKEEGVKFWDIDSFTVKNPITNKPYIPWSSIKWKMRYLIEMIEYKWELSEWAVADDNFDPSIAFWYTSSKTSRPSLILFDDFYLNDKYDKLFDELDYNEFYEIKWENTISRIKQEAKPRFIERVPAWVEFEWWITLIEIEEDNKVILSIEKLEEILDRWFKYLSFNYLWWNWSRWYWRIEVNKGEKINVL